MFSISVINFASPVYEQTKIFRERILRVPLGLRLSEKDVDGENQQIHIAALDEAGNVVGTVLLKPLTGQVVKLRQMAVDDKIQGVGLGKKIVTYAEGVAKEKGFATIEMHARVSAVGFYKKLGYKTEGDSFIEVTIPNIRMAKRLDSITSSTK